MSDLAELVQYLGLQRVEVVNRPSSAGLSFAGDVSEQAKADCNEHTASLKSMVPATGKPHRFVAILGGPMVKDREAQVRTDAFYAWPC